MSDRHTVHRVCPFCEATCGLAVEVEGDSIVAVRGDKQDPFSRGYICPKAHGLKELYHDRDRLRHPVRRTARGWEQISWEQAYDEVASRLLEIRRAVRQQRDRDVHRKSDRSRPGRGALPAGVTARARQPQHLQLYGDRYAAKNRPDRPDVRRPVPDLHSGARYRSYPLPADHRRESRHLARQPDDDARRAGTPESRRRTRRQSGRDRPAAHRDRQDRERASIYPAGHRRGVPARDRSHAVR